MAERSAFDEQQTADDLAWATITPRKCRHQWSGSIVDGMAWPAKCRYCSLVTEDPDAYFRPRDWDNEDVDRFTACPSAPDGVHDPMRVYCLRCRKEQDPAVSRRGRNNRKRGNSIELWVCRLLGIERVGQYGRIEDGGSDRDFLRIQVKSGGAHQASLLGKIHTIPVNAAQLRGWVTVSTPGPGHPREGVISFDLREFAAWYGKGTDEEAA